MYVKRVNVQGQCPGVPWLVEDGGRGGTIKEIEKEQLPRLKREPGVGCPGSQVKKASRTMSPNLISNMDAIGDLDKSSHGGMTEDKSLTGEGLREGGRKLETKYRQSF